MSMSEIESNFEHLKETRGWTVEGDTVDMSKTLEQNGIDALSIAKRKAAARGVPTGIVDGTISMNDLMSYLKSVDPGEVLGARLYIKLTDWVGKIAELLDIPLDDPQ
jgi:hypothetical protein